MGPGSAFAPHAPSDRHHRWDRCARAAWCEPSLALPAPGGSPRHAAPPLHGPRPPRHAGQAWPAPLDRCPPVAQWFQRAPGGAGLPRRVVARPLVCSEGGACGRRVGCLRRPRPRRDRFVAAASGAQHHVNRQGAPARVADRPTATAPWATAMPRTVITGPPAEPGTGGRGRGATAPVRHGLLGAPRAQARAPAPGPALLAPALAHRHGAVRPSTRQEAPGLVAAGAPPRPISARIRCKSEKMRAYCMR
jgi:hypothetical protein